MTEHIYVVSDTHGETAYVAETIRRHPEIDRIFHLGDYAWDAEELENRVGRNVLVVKGNNDWGSDAPEERLLRIEGFSILLLHGHQFGVHRSRARLWERAKEKQADIVLYGHTHHFLVEEEAGVLLMNPGSPTYPRGGEPSAAILTLCEGKKPTIKKIAID